MSRTFVIEAVMLAVHGQLLLPLHPVEYMIPYSTIQELYELQDTKEPLMMESQEDEHVKGVIRELIAFFEEPLNKKKIERALQQPWRKSPPLPINEHVTFTIIYAVDQAEYGELFDPIETELIVTATREKTALLTDQLEFLDRLLDASVPVEAYDVEDFEFAVEGDFLV